MPSPRPRRPRAGAPRPAGDLLAPATRPSRAPVRRATAPAPAPSPAARGPGRTRRVRVVVTGGPTREHLDDVRYLSNASTGRMGWELARAARDRGASVRLVLGPSELPPLQGVVTTRVVSARDLLEATRRAVEDATLVLFAAAPSDWRPAARVRGKIKRADAPLRRIELVENPDVAETLGRTKGSRVHVGFALEAADGMRNAARKLRAKRFDAIVLNAPENVGGEGGGEAWLLRPDGTRERLPTGDKARLARAILDRVWPAPPRG